MESPEPSYAWDVSFIQKLKRVPGVIFSGLDQCPYGARTKKATGILSGAQWMSDVKLRCEDVRPHAHMEGGLTGKTWDPLTGRMVWKTSKAAEYPQGLCHAWALSLKAWLLSDAGVKYMSQRTLVKVSPFQMVRLDMLGTNKSQAVYQMERLEASRNQCKSKRALREEENSSVVGGLRNPRRAVALSLKLRRVGERIRTVLDQCYSVDHLKHFEATVGMDDETVYRCRCALADEFNAEVTCDRVVGYQVSLLGALLSEAGDLDASVSPDWLQHGVPLGVSRPKANTGIFPATDDVSAAIKASQVIGTLLEDWDGSASNYKSFYDAGDKAQSELDRLVQDERADCVDTWEQVVEMVGIDAKLTQLACIVKMKGGKEKVRLVVDMRRSGINGRMCLLERVVLPRIPDVAKSCEELLKVSSRADQLEFFVCDFSDAFYTLKLHDSERKWVICKGLNGRPWTAMLWAALHAAKLQSAAGPKRESTRVRKGLAFKRQIEHAVLWLDHMLRAKGAFLDGSSVVPLARVYRFRQDVPFVSAGTDACPTGLGGYLEVGKKPVVYFKLPVDDALCKILGGGAQVGDPAFQTEWELLSIFIAVCLFSRFLKSTRIRLFIQSDNTAALKAALDFQASSPLMCSLAAEISIQLEAGCEGLSAKNEFESGKAFEVFSDAMYAPQTVASKAALRNTWSQISRELGLEPLPLNPAKIHQVCSVLRASNFRSTYSYLCEMRQLHMRSGFPWDSTLEIAVKDAKRAATRGIGPPVKAEEIPEDVLVKVWNSGSLLEGRASWPAMGHEVWVLATAFLLREVELAGLRMGQTETYLDMAKRCVTLYLPVSKSDPVGKGCRRTLACSCKATRDAICPFCAAESLVSNQIMRTGVEPSDPEADEIPLVATEQSRWETVKKEAVIEAVRGDLEELLKGSPELRGRFDPEKVTGHSFRRSGAKALARRGTPIDLVQFMARHSSNAILGYVEEAIEESPSGTTRLQEHLELRELVNKALKDCAGLKESVESVTKKLSEGAGGTQIQLDKDLVLQTFDRWARPEVVHNLATRKLHSTEGNCFRANPKDWATSCGWRWVASGKEARACLETNDLPSDFSVCAKCRDKIPAWVFNGD
eukprot:s3386_g6.t1